MKYRNLIAKYPLRLTAILLALLCAIVISYPAIFGKLGGEGHILKRNVHNAEQGVLTLHMELELYQNAQGKLPIENEEHAKAFFAELGFEICPQSSLSLDPWGNPYQFLKRNRSDDQYELDVYSKGRDGISESNGNDPDDINSWDNTRQWRSHYFP